jgi:hypothetical protein
LKKISILNRIKYEQVYDDENVEYLSFPVHHKYKKQVASYATEDTHDVDQRDIEQMIANAYNQAVPLTERSGILRLSEENNIADLDELSEFVFQGMHSSAKIFDNSSLSAVQVDEDLNLEEANGKSEIDDDLSEENEDDDCPVDDEGNQDNRIRSAKTNFTRMKILNDVQVSKRNSYFKVNINGSANYLYNQSACWLLTDNRSHLSNDRLARVIQTNHKDHAQRL